MPTSSFNKRSSISPAIISLLCVTALLFSGPAYSGAWTGPKGSSYNKFGVNYFWSKKNFDGKASIFNGSDIEDANSTFTDLNFTYYGEYGFRDDLSGFLSFPFKTIKADPDSGPSDSTTGVGDIDVGLRYNLYNGDKGVFSVQGLVKIPEAYDQDDNPPLGNHQYDVEGRLLYGKSLYPMPIYFGLEAGYRKRFSNPSDEYKYLVEVGYTATEKLYLRTKLDGTTSAKNAGNATGTAGNPTLAPDFDLGKLELTAGYTIIKDLFVEFTWTPTIYGRDTAYGNTLGLALIYAIRPKKAEVILGE